jgi:hypothetical protein
MSVTMTVGRRTNTARVLSQFKVAEGTGERLVLQSKRIGALLAAAFLGTFGGIVTAATSHFYPPLDRNDLGTLLVGGVFGVVPLALALMFLYFGLRRPERIVVDPGARQVRFERRRDPLTLPFDLLAEVCVRTENRSRARERCIVHPVVLVTRDGREFQVDAASDVEQMIALAAKLRHATGIPPAEEGAA